jgi:DNA-binding winged helix-turn-helix (wHTH) protein
MIYRFDEFQVDDEALEMRRGRSRVNVQAKVLDVITYLIRHRARVVEKREILTQVWPGVRVGQTSVAHAIMAARKALGDDGGTPRVILTVRGRGYRFSPTVEEIAGPAAPRARGARPAEGARSPLAASDAGEERLRTVDRLGALLSEWVRYTRQLSDRLALGAAPTERERQVAASLDLAVAVVTTASSGRKVSIHIV